MIDRRPVRPRRSCLAVPGSSPKMLAKAQGLGADMVFLDLEDAVAPEAKAAARASVVDALNDGDFSGKTRAVRIHAATTPWCYRDGVSFVECAGLYLDTLVLPKVHDAAHVHWLDLTLTQVERALGLAVGRIGIEAQIESAHGLAEVETIAAASPRLETLVFGPADFMASLGMRTLVVGEQPAGYPDGDAYHYVLMRLLVTARARGVSAIDGPFLQIRDVEGFRRTARRSAALGFDGKWVVHPDQIEAANETYAPSQPDYDRAELILDAYAWATSSAGGRRGAVRLGEEMIDEASRKMALVVAAKGRAAGLVRTSMFTPLDS